MTVDEKLVMFRGQCLFANTFHLNQGDMAQKFGLFAIVQLVMPGRWRYKPEMKLVEEEKPIRERELYSN